MDQVATRARQLYDRFFNSLDQAKYAWEEAPSGLAFAVTQRYVGGKKYSRAGGITSHQLRFIATTYENDDEAIAKIHDVVIKGEKIGQPQRKNQVSIDQESLERLIAERVAAALAAVPKPPTEPAPKAAEPKLPPLVDTLDYDTWLTRAELAGLGMPRRSPKNQNQVDGRWLRWQRDAWLRFESANKK